MISVRIKCKPWLNMKSNKPTFNNIHKTYSSFNEDKVIFKWDQFREELYRKALSFDNCINKRNILEDELHKT